MEDDRINLKQPWKQLDEATRKHIFLCIFRDNRNLITRLSREMHGYTPKGLARRPSTIVSRIDDLLFSLDGGLYARDFFRSYFVNCEPTINDLYLIHFKRIAREDPSKV